MRNYSLLCLALAMVAIFAACSNPEPASAPAPQPNTDLPKPAPKAAPALEATPAPAAETAPAPVPDTAVQPAAPAAGAALVGSTWKIGEFTANFKDATTVSLKGGALASIAPDGLDAKYTLADGKIEVNTMGMTKTGTFDGTNLIIDGSTAVRQQ